MGSLCGCVDGGVDGWPRVVGCPRAKPAAADGSLGDALAGVDRCPSTDEHATLQSATSYQPSRAYKSTRYKPAHAHVHAYADSFLHFDIVARHGDSVGDSSRAECDTLGGGPGHRYGGGDDHPKWSGTDGDSYPGSNSLSGAGDGDSRFSYPDYAAGRGFDCCA